MSFGETVFLFVLALVVFGPKKLPQIARQEGKYLNEFRRWARETELHARNMVIALGQ